MAAAALLASYSAFSWLMGFVTYQHHTHPDLPWFDHEGEWSRAQAQIAAALHVQFPRWIEILFLEILSHPAHHVDPRIPLYRLHKGQQALEQTLPSVVRVVRWTPREFLRTMRSCKLYDFRDRQWLDFAGRPTAPPHSTRDPGEPQLIPTIETTIDAEVLAARRS